MVKGAEARAVLAGKREAVRARRLHVLLRLLERYPDKTNKDLAAILEVSPTTVARYLKLLRRRGVLPPRRVPQGPRSSKELREGRINRLIDIINDRPTLTPREAADALGVSKDTIRDYLSTLKSRGVVPKYFALKGEAETRRERERLARRPKILRGIREDCTYGDIAESLGVTPQRIAQDIKYMRKAGDSGLERALKERERLRAKRRPKRRRPADLEAAADKFLLREVGLNLEWTNRMNAASYYSEALLKILADGPRAAKDLLEDPDVKTLKRNGLIKGINLGGYQVTIEAFAALFLLGFRHPRPFTTPQTTTSQNGRMVREGIPTPRVTLEKNR